MLLMVVGMLVVWGGLAWFAVTVLWKLFISFS
jgi:hypothetical protein